MITALAVYRMEEPFQDELEQLRARSLLRRLREIASAQGPSVDLVGQYLVNFSSNDYLGLAADERLRAAAKHAIDKFGLAQAHPVWFREHSRRMWHWSARLQNGKTCRPRLLLIAVTRRRSALFPPSPGKTTSLFSINSLMLRWSMVHA